MTPPWRRPRRSRRRTSRGRRVRVRQDQSVGPAGTRIEVPEPAGHPSGGSHTASASESVGAAHSRSGEALMTPTAVSVRLIAGAPVALIDHPRAERAAAGTAPTLSPSMPKRPYRQVADSWFSRASSHPLEVGRSGSNATSSPGGCSCRQVQRAYGLHRRAVVKRSRGRPPDVRGARARVPATTNRRARHRNPASRPHVRHG